MTVNSDIRIDRDCCGAEVCKTSERERERERKRERESIGRKGEEGEEEKENTNCILQSTNETSSQLHSMDIIQHNTIQHNNIN